jgi:hypothetical protein
VLLLLLKQLFLLLQSSQVKELKIVTNAVLNIVRSVTKKKEKIATNAVLNIAKKKML